MAMKSENSSQDAEQRKRELARERNRKYRQRKANQSEEDLSKPPLFYPPPPEIPKSEVIEGLKTWFSSSPLSTENCPLSKTDIPISKTEIPLSITETLNITPPDLPIPQEIETPRHERPQASWLSVTERLSVTVSVTLSVSITVLLCYFQAETYLEDGMTKPLSWAVAIICETLLLHLSASLRRSVTHLFLFVTLFSYNLATMSFNVYKKHVTETHETHHRDASQRMIQDVFNRAKNSYDMAAANGWVTKAQKILKTLEDLGDKYAEPRIYLDADVIKFHSIGLIILRAILMLANALLVHRIFAKD